jgi:choline dehydrogenase-like flavoprotein
MFETVAGPPAYVAMSLPLAGHRHAEVMSSYRSLAQLGMMVSDSSAGSVHRVGRRAVIRYDLARADVEKFRLGMTRLDQLLRAAGAREVFLPLPAGITPETLRAHHLRLMAFHPLGTARADAHPQRGVVDGQLAVHGLAGLYVADGSVVPGALGVNPQLTIMALATRLAFHLLEIPCPS